MERIHVFQVVWLAIVTAVGLGSLAFGVYELRRGSARWGRRGESIVKAEEPFYFWMIIAGRFGSFLVACFMFWFGMGMMDSIS